MSRVFRHLVVAFRARSARERVLIMGGGAVVACAILFTQILAPFAQGLASTRAAANAERQILARELALIAATDQTVAALQRAREHERELLATFVSASNAALAEAAVIDLIEKTAFVSGMLLESIRGVKAEASAQPTAADTATSSHTRVEPVGVWISGQGELRSVVTFLQRIESSPVFLRVRQLALDPGPVRATSPRDQNSDGAAPSGVISFTALIEGLRRS